MRKNKHLLLWSSLAALGVLAAAAFQENFLQDWRQVQRSVRSRLPRDKADRFGIRLRQVVAPDVEASDRCVSCHVGMASGEAGVAGDRLYGPHPKLPHDPAAFGCTVCHAGQGRATTTADGHGRVKHWPEPMLDKGYLYAGCGTCHAPVGVPALPALENGRNLVERYDCLTCHRLDGRGGTTRPDAAAGVDGPDLSLSDAKGFRRDWYAHHAAERQRAAAGSAWATAFGEVAPADVQAIEAYLRTRMGAPGFVEARAALLSSGCLGCHRVGNAGGDDGPELTRAGLRDPGQTNFSGVPLPHSMESWFIEHFRVPAGVVAGSRMPPVALDDARLRDLTFAVLSLRRQDRSSRFWPGDRSRAERFGEREFAGDGETLYAAFCSGCHGDRGQGARSPGTQRYPAIGNPDFLGAASDSFVIETIRRGRPGRRMPAWRDMATGLRPEEIDAVAARVRALGGGVKPPEAATATPARWVSGDPAVGKRLFAASCAGCHGAAGGGGEGPALANRVFLETADDTFLMETIRRGRRGTAMLGFTAGSTVRSALSDQEIQAVVAFVRTWESKS